MPRCLLVFVSALLFVRTAAAQDLVRYVIQLADVKAGDAAAVRTGRLDVAALGGQEIENWRTFLQVNKAICPTGKCNFRYELALPERKAK